MGFTKENNSWTTDGEGVTIDTHDDERVVLYQIHKLNEAQDDHHNFCNARF